MPPRFFSQQSIAGETLTLTGDEVKHIVGAHRLGPGDNIVVFDGSGMEFLAKIEESQKKAVLVSILEQRPISRELSIELVLAVALPKGDRQKVLVEKLVELGVSRLIPVNCQRSVAVASSKSTERLDRRVIEASKQSGRNKLMEIADPVSFAELLQIGGRDRYLSHPYDSRPWTELASNLENVDSVLVAVGPEGGFTDNEVQLAHQAGWQSVSLGPTILRVETAAVAAATLFGIGRLPT